MLKEGKKNINDYLNTKDTEQMAYALYPKLRKGELSFSELLEILNVNVETLEQIYWKYNLPTVFLTDKELELPIEKQIQML